MIAYLRSARKAIIAVTVAAYSVFCFSQTSGFGPGACTAIEGSQTCLDSTPCKTDSGGNTVCLANAVAPTGAITTTLSCWQYSYAYACSTPGQNNCSIYQNDPKCSVLTSTCINTVPATGNCTSWNVKYQCGSSSTTSSISCSSGLFDSSQFTAPDNTNSNFAKSAAALEMMREAEVYSTSGNNIFKGVKETCDEGYYGIKNCCKSMPGAKSNAAVASIAYSTAAGIVKYVGANAINAASPYVYDAMYTVQNWIAEMTSAVSTVGSNAPTSTSLPTDFSVSAYGFTYSTGAFDAADAMAGTSEVADFGAGGSLSFNPYMLAAQLVIMYIQSLAQCTQEEQMLGMHKGAGLSYYVNTTCESVGLGAKVCTQNYCSFNSVLAKIVNTQGKPQLGLDVTDCDGLTVDQITKIDFKKIDFSEFTDQVQADALQNQPSSSTINNAYTPIISTTTGGTSQSSSKPVTPKYP